MKLKAKIFVVLLVLAAGVVVLQFRETFSQMFLVYAKPQLFDTIPRTIKAMIN